MIQRDNGQGVVTVRGVVRCVSQSVAHALQIYGISAELDRRDETGLVCGFYDEEQPPCLLLADECSQILQVSCQ